MSNGEPRPHRHALDPFGAKKRIAASILPPLWWGADLSMRRRPRKLKLKRASKRRARSGRVPFGGDGLEEEGGSAKTYEQQREEIRRELQSYAPGSLRGASRFHVDRGTLSAVDGYASAEDSGTALKLPEISALQEKSKLALAQLRASADKELNDRKKRSKPRRAVGRKLSASGKSVKARKVQDQAGGDAELDSIRREFGSVSDAVTPKGKGGDFLFIVGGPKGESTHGAAAGNTVVAEEKDSEDEIEISKSNFLFVVGSPNRRAVDDKALQHRTRALLLRVFKAWHEHLRFGRGKNKAVEEVGKVEEHKEYEESSDGRKKGKEEEQDANRTATAATISLDDGKGGQIRLTIDTTLENTMHVLRNLGIDKQENKLDGRKEEEEEKKENEGDSDKGATPKKAATIPLQPTILSRYYVQRATGAERVLRWPGQLRSYPKRKRQRTRSLSPKRSPRVSLGPTKRADGTVRPRVRQRQRHRPRDFVAWEAHHSRRYNTNDSERFAEARQGFQAFFPAPSSSYGAQRPVLSTGGDSMLQAMGLIPREALRGGRTEQEGRDDKQPAGMEQVTQFNLAKRQNQDEAAREKTEILLDVTHDDAELLAQHEAEQEALAALGTTKMTPRGKVKVEAKVEPSTEPKNELLYDEEEVEIPKVGGPVDISAITKDDAKAWFEAAVKESSRQVGGFAMW